MRQRLDIGIFLVLVEDIVECWLVLIGRCARDDDLFAFDDGHRPDQESN